MQASEFIFKVPKVRKRWRSLYCTEQISELNEIWESSHAKCKSTSSVKDGKPPSFVRNLFSVNPAEVVEQDYSPSFDRTELTENKDVLFKASQRSKYTIGLFDELRTPATNSSRVTEMSESYRQSGFDSSRSSFWQQPTNSSKPNFDSESEKIFGTTNASTSTIRSDITPGSPDILIVKDESISTDSDDDWESTTPPAPSSPSDHTVPDLADLNTISTPSEYLLFGGPFTQPQPEEWNTSEVQENTQSLMHQQISSLDQIFTDFYD